MPTPVPVTALAAALAAALLLAACGSDSGGEGAGGGRPLVVATTTQVGDFAREVAGDRAVVRQILAPSSDPHDYEPRPSDVAAIADASLVVRSGGDVDDWLADLVQNAGSGVATLTLADAIGAARRDDPHWWQDPRNAIRAVAEIRDALVAADSAGRATYTANARAYASRLRALDAAIDACMARIPASRRKLVTDHDALGYYADRYGIEVVGTVIPARSTQAQASAGATARLVRTIRSAGVTTIFPESSVNTRLTRAIAREAGATVGPPLYADALGARGSDGATYLGALRANTRALESGFTDRPSRCEL